MTMALCVGELCTPDEALPLAEKALAPNATLVLCGPSRVGKTLLAQYLGHAFVLHAEDLADARTHVRTFAQNAACHANAPRILHIESVHALELADLVRWRRTWGAPLAHLAWIVCCDHALGTTPSSATVLTLRPDIITAESCTQPLVRLDSAPLAPFMRAIVYNDRPKTLDESGAIAHMTRETGTRLAHLAADAVVRRASASARAFEATEALSVGDLLTGFYAHGDANTEGGALSEDARRMWHTLAVQYPLVCVSDVADAAERERLIWGMDTELDMAILDAHASGEWVWPQQVIKLLRKDKRVPNGTPTATIHRAIAGLVHRGILERKTEPNAQGKVQSSHRIVLPSKGT